MARLTRRRVRTARKTRKRPRPKRPKSPKIQRRTTKRRSAHKPRARSTARKPK